MDQPEWTKTEKDKAWAISMLKPFNSGELVAEQLLNYFFPTAGHKKVTQVLMLFEMAKVVLKFKAFFSGSETLLMEESLFAYFMADKHRRELIKRKTENILGLFKLQAAKIGTENVIEMVRGVLGMKLKQEKVDAKPASNEQKPTDLPTGNDKTETQIVVASKEGQPQEEKKKEGPQYYIDKESLVKTF